LEKIYDVASVLKAFRVVQERHADASLWIAGSGSEDGNLRSLVSALNLRNVRFLGEVAHADLAGVYRECDIYVNASLVDNFPGALLEASAAGLAVVTTSAGGIPFIYENGRSAWMVEPGDWRGLAKGIETVLESPSVAADMTKAAATVVRACEWTEVRARLFEAYGLRLDPREPDNGRLDGARCAAG
jgi:glycosyltransferase involved in cell wall biosynthesis